ncbi:MAG: YbaB/EbfC family nucleoid-associated protein [Candidatus Ornithospirochaeta sp.]|nr:YbaB/EbfC family nucleoid-associated protein [Candidatus Ornithospirochaeta sp.]
MKTIKEQLSLLKATGSSGAGLVEVSINGDYHVERIEINPVMLNPDDKSTLEVLLVSAFNDATEKMKSNIEDYTRQKLSSMGIRQ